MNGQDHPRAPRPPRRRRAFTLVEALATMSILAVVALAASRIIFAATDAYAAEATRSELASSLSSAMERIAAELRAIPARAGSPGAPWIDSVTAGSIEFGDGNHLTGTDGRVFLSIESGPARVLVGASATLVIACFDEQGGALAPTLAGPACDNIRRVEITLSQSRGGVTETLRTRIFLRCTMGAGG